MLFYTEIIKVYLQDKLMEVEEFVLEEPHLHQILNYQFQMINSTFLSHVPCQPFIHSATIGYINSTRNIPYYLLNWI